MKSMIKHVTQHVANNTEKATDKPCTECNYDNDYYGDLACTSANSTAAKPRA